MTNQTLNPGVWNDNPGTFGADRCENNENDRKNTREPGAACSLRGLGGGGTGYHIAPAISGMGCP